MAVVSSQVFSGPPGTKTNTLFSPTFPATVVVTVISNSGYATTVNLECPAGFSIWNDTIAPLDNIEIRGLVLTPGNALFATDNSQAPDGILYLVSGYNNQ